jgi:hypothetical protein
MELVDKTPKPPVEKKGALVKRLKKDLETPSVTFTSRENFSSFATVRAILGKKTSYGQVMCDHLARTLHAMKGVFAFIGPARVYPDRTYENRAATFRGAGVQGENCVALLAEWKARRSHKLKEVTNLIRSMELAEGLRVRQMEEGMLQLLVKVPVTEPFSSLQDVGFGISQALPIIVADVDLGKGGTLMVSQPELHLHPRAQAAFANYFASGFKERERRYVIETHSEYLINRFRLLISKGELEENDVKLYHMTAKEGGFEPTQITLRKDGAIDGAPDDFFNTYRMDTFEIAMSI